MTYSFLIDGLEPENRAKLDAILDGNEDTKGKAARERAAVDVAMRFAR